MKAGVNGSMMIEAQRRCLRKRPKSRWPALSGRSRQANGLRISLEGLCELQARFRHGRCGTLVLGFGRTGRVVIFDDTSRPNPDRIDDRFRDPKVDGPLHLRSDPNSAAEEVHVDLLTAMPAEFPNCARIVWLLDELAGDRSEGVVPKR